jgi:hypothetical protein
MNKVMIPFLFLFFSGCVTSQAHLPFEENEITEIRSGDYEAIYFEDFKLHNNVWGKQEITHYTQELFTVSGVSGDGFGWRWTWPQTGRVLAYPEIIYGSNPWDHHSMNNQFPRKLNDNPVIVSYTLHEQMKPTCNLALEFFIVPDETPSPDEITHEVMIWQISKGMVPAGRFMGTFDYDETEYKVFYNPGHVPGPGSDVSGWDYIAFLAKENVLSAELDLSRFINYLLEENFIDNPELFMTGVELGTEILGGSGLIYFEEFSVTADPAVY